MTKIVLEEFDKDSYKVSGGLTVLGFQWLTLSNHLTATVHSGDGKCINKNTKKGKSSKKLVKLQKRNNSYFYPDETIFTQTTDFHMIRYLPVCVSCHTLTRE
jgi:DNA gyrase subunit B